MRVRSLFRVSAPIRHEWASISSPVLLACAGLTLAAIATYWNSLSGPFVFDDINAVQENLSIRHLLPLSGVLMPSHDLGQTTGGRPILNLSFAINYALGGPNVRGYHLFNLAVHIASGLLLFGIVRRTLLRDSVAPRFAREATPLALTIALLWLVHPLQTEAVTYIAQRAESLATLFYLLAIYSFVRGVERHPPGRVWFSLSAGACLVGMGCKEIVVTAPLMIFLYDRTFVAGSFRGAWRSRKATYLALAGTWLVLLCFLAETGNPRGTSAGFNGTVEWWAYTLTQSRALIHYLRLGLFPTELVFDYGTGVTTSLAAVWPYMAAVACLLGAACYALVRHPATGFLGAFFFVTIAPSSSVVPIVTQTWAEHRMYLPLAAEITLLVMGLSFVSRRFVWLAALAAIPLGVLTISRNEDYRTARALWADTVRKCPANPRAHLGLGDALQADGSNQAAVHEFREAVRLDPSFARAHAALGRALIAEQQTSEALAHAQKAVLLAPCDAMMRCNLGHVLRKAGRAREALVQYEIGVQLLPDNAVVQAELATGLMSVGDLAGAISHYQIALNMDPLLTEARSDLGTAFLTANRFQEAVSCYEQVLQVTPQDADVHFLLGAALSRLGRSQEAMIQFKTALALNPSQTDAQRELHRLEILARSVPVAPASRGAAQRQPENTN